MQRLKENLAHPAIVFKCSRSFDSIGSFDKDQFVLEYFVQDTLRADKLDVSAFVRDERGIEELCLLTISFQALTILSM